MGIIDRSRKQTAVYWGLGGNESAGVDFDDYGQPLYTAPAEIRVRWEDVNEEIVLEDKTTMISRAKVMTGIDVRPGELLFLGELTDLPAGVDPREVDGAWEIMKFNKLPNLKATEFLRTAFL